MQIHAYTMNVRQRMLCDECIFVNAEREAGSDISGDAKQKQSGVRG